MDITSLSMSPVSVELAPAVYSRRRGLFLTRRREEDDSDRLNMVITKGPPPRFPDFDDNEEEKQESSRDINGSLDVILDSVISRDPEYQESQSIYHRSTKNESTSSSCTSTKTHSFSSPRVKRLRTEGPNIPSINEECSCVPCQSNSFLDPVCNEDKKILHVNE